MKLSITCFLILLYPIPARPVVHDVPAATFTVALDATPWTLEVELDRADVARALVPAGVDLRTLSAYLTEHTGWVADGRELALALCTMRADHHHLRLRGEIAGAAGAIERLEVKNTCLLEVEAEQSNTVILVRDGAERGFRLHGGRRRVVVEY